MRVQTRENSVGPYSCSEDKPDNLSTISIVCGALVIAHNEKETTGDTGVDVISEVDTDSKLQGKDISHKETSLLEEGYHVRMQKCYSPTIPDSNLDQESDETDTNMAIADTSINKAEVHHQKEESQTQKGIVMPSIQKEEESSKPRSNTDEDSTSKESFNTSNHNQRTVENDSILAGATNYIRKQKNYSQDTLEIYQEEEAGLTREGLCPNM